MTDAISTTTVNYDALFSERTNNVDGLCPLPFGIDRFEQALRVLEIDNNINFNLIEQTNQTFKTRISSTQVNYLYAEDSMLLSAAANTAEGCFEA